MLRPATPLSILLFVAFVFLLLSVISTPVIKAIPLGSFKDITYGVFGYCRPDKDGGCSSIGIGYSPDKLFDQTSKDFDLPASVRKTISAILIVHPVAALLTLIMFIMAVASHMHSPSHSARYLLVLFIFTVITFLVTVLAFVIDVILFIPHMAWGSYIVVAAAILIAISGVVACIMRRTLVSRKARKQRIAENAEMSGENYYNREIQKSSFTTSNQAAVPMASGGSSGVNDSLPTFATYENMRKDDQVSDERIPLTQRNTHERSPNAPANEMVSPIDTASIPGSRSASRDRYGNRPGPPDPYGMPREHPSRRGRGDMQPPGGLRGGPGGMQSRGGYDGYAAPMRGRGGFGPRGRGGFGPRGGRGGYGPPPRGAYGPGGMRGGRPPPMAYNNVQGQYDRRPSAEGYAYGQQPETGFDGSSNPNNEYRPYEAGGSDLPRAESPPPLPGTGPASSIGQAVEMDAAPVYDAPHGFGQYGQLRDSDVDVAGMVGLQQGHGPERSAAHMSEGSKYSTDEYVAPRAAWNQDSGRNSPRTASPANSYRRDPAETQRIPPLAPRENNGNYYEDVDPRFGNHSVQQQPLPPSNTSNTHLMPGVPDYEDVHSNIDGARSPAESERSNFTSISQRGINPQWNPNQQHRPPMPVNQGPSSRQKVQRRHDMLLDNSDFQVPSGRAGNAQRGGPGMIPGSAYPTGPI